MSLPAIDGGHFWLRCSSALALLSLRLPVRLPNHLMLLLMLPVVLRPGPPLSMSAELLEQLRRLQHSTQWQGRSTREDSAIQLNVGCTGRLQ